MMWWMPSSVIMVPCEMPHKHHLVWEITRKSRHMCDEEWLMCKFRCVLPIYVIICDVWYVMCWPIPRQAPYIQSTTSSTYTYTSEPAHSHIHIQSIYINIRAGAHASHMNMPSCDLWKHEERFRLLMLGDLSKHTTSLVLRLINQSHGDVPT